MRINLREEGGFCPWLAGPVAFRLVVTWYNMAEALGGGRRSSGGNRLVKETGREKSYNALQGHCPNDLTSSHQAPLLKPPFSYSAWASAWPFGNISPNHSDRWMSKGTDRYTSV
jgi:hypothetical protein